MTYTIYDIRRWRRVMRSGRCGVGGFRIQSRAAKPRQASSSHVKLCQTLEFLKGPEHPNRCRFIHALRVGTTRAPSACAEAAASKLLIPSFPMISHQITDFLNSFLPPRRYRRTAIRLRCATTRQASRLLSDRAQSCLIVLNRAYVHPKF